MRDYYEPFILKPARMPILKIEPERFTEKELRGFDIALGHRRNAQRTKMRLVFQSCGMTENKYRKSGGVVPPTNKSLTVDKENK